MLPRSGLLWFQFTLLVEGLKSWKSWPTRSQWGGVSRSEWSRHRQIVFQIVAAIIVVVHVCCFLLYARLLHNVFVVVNEGRKVSGEAGIEARRCLQPMWE